MSKVITSNRINFSGSEYTVCGCCGALFRENNKGSAEIAADNDHNGILILDKKEYTEVTEDHFAVKHVETKNGILTVITKS